MKNLIALSLAALIAPLSMFGQNPAVQPTQSPLPVIDNDVVKITTNLIQLDVTVTDSNGKAITDLRPDELELYENGQKQKLTHFSFVSGGPVRNEKAKPVDKGSVPIPQSALRANQIKRAMALIVDDLSLSFESVYYTRRALKKFVDEQMQDGDLVAILRTGAGMGALQQFTSDKRLLYAAIQKVSWNPLGGGGIGAFATVDPSSETGADDSLADFRNSVFSIGTLGALRFVVTGMSELPGRKSVILFSDGFQLNDSSSNGFGGSSRVVDFMRQLVDAANRASVVFYTIDPRGLQYTGPTAADNLSGMSGAAIGQLMATRSQRLSDTQSGLDYLSKETGGFSIKNNNDVIGGVRRVLEDQSYYLVAYEPDSDTFDPVKRLFNKLEVKVSRPKARVRYRSGFINVAERPVSKTNSALSPVNQLKAALVSPFAVNGISLHLNPLFANDPKNGTFVNSLLHVDTSDLQFVDAPNGGKKVVFDVLAVIFGDNGQIVGQINKTITLTVQPRLYKKMMAEGFVYYFIFPIKTPGAYQYRVAMRDSGNGNVGSASQFIEIPNLKKGRLATSGILFEKMTLDEWHATGEGKVDREGRDLMLDTALRRVRKGSMLRYDYQIYNAKLDQSKRPQISTSARVYYDGKLILSSDEKPLDLTGKNDFQHLSASGAITISDDMPAGEYILQVVVRDLQAKEKQQIATQYIQFEVIDK